MTTTSNETTSAVAIDPALVKAWATLVAFMPDPIVKVAASANDFAICDARKVHPKVGLELIRQGMIKPLTDMSRDKATEETAAELNKRRNAKIANWYNGDFSVRGGGVSDPVGVQTREEIITALKAAGMTGGDLKEASKGRADEILARIFSGDELKAKLAFYRAKAEATIKSRREAAESFRGKVDLKAIAARI